MNRANRFGICRRWHIGGLGAVWLVMVWAGLCAAEPTGLGVGFGDAVFQARRAVSWEEGGGQVLVLEQEVSVLLGEHLYTADSARVTVAAKGGDDAQGQVVVADLVGARGGRRGGEVAAVSDRLRVSGVAVGKIHLVADVHEKGAGPVEQAIGNRGLAGGRQTPGDGDLRGGGLIPVQETVGFTADKIIVERIGTGEHAVLLSGNVRVGLRRLDEGVGGGGGGGVTLSAERAVLFVDAGKVDGEPGSGREVDSQAIKGVYLEDNVVLTDGSYTVRAPRVYYELASNRAVVLDAVMYTWDVKRGVPIYVRADMLRQRSQSSWAAEGAVLTTSEFAVPHIAIAADRVMFERGKDPEGGDQYRFSAEDMTLRVGKTPVFYWPGIGGEAGESHGLPVRGVKVGSARHDGVKMETTWDMFALSGQTAPRGVELLGRADVVGEHGAALGLDMKYDQPRMNGSFSSYYLLHDTGDDEISNRDDVKFDGDVRGSTLWRHRQYLRDRWQLSLEMGHVSDETFLEEFFPDQAYTSKPYEASLYLKKQEGSRAFTFLSSYDLQDFTPQLVTLQAPGYTVDKVPELGFYDIGTDVFDGRMTYYGHTSLSRMRIRVGEDDPEDRGFRARQSRKIFGIPETTNFDDAARAAGIPSGYRTRFDTRHEIQMPFMAGDFDVVPYVVGRVTLYDDDFKEFSGEDDQERFWGAVGVRVNTQVSKVYNQVDDPTLDLHRLRHIVEPSVDVFVMGSSIESDDLVIYDDPVENLQEGFGVRLGVRNTLQTQRGGEGRWRSVDWLTFNTDLVLRSNDVDTETHVARFFDYRPEYSRGGNHVHSEVRWMASETLAAVGEVTVNLEDADQVAQWRIGATLEHSDRLVSYLDYVDIDPLSSRLLHHGVRYRLTSKYQMAFTHTLDLAEDLSRRLELTLERRLPRWRMRVVASHDDDDDEQSIGVVLIPDGAPSSDL